jgi:hypothetical protein
MAFVFLIGYRLKLKADDNDALGRKHDSDGA